MTGAFLNDKEFAQAAAAGGPFVEPFDAEAIKAASIDLRISDERYEYSFDQYRLGDELNEDATIHSKFTEIWIEPGKSAYVGLLEEIRIPANALGLVFPRSSLTRLGIAIFPVYMNPGYIGRMPLTIANHGHSKICVVPGARVAQLLCARLSGPVKTDYGNQAAAKYHEENISGAKHDDEDFKSALDRVIKTRMPELQKT